MAEQLLGTWKLCSSVGFEEYMQSVGVDFVTRKAGSVIKPNVIFSKDGDKYSLKTESTFKNTEVNFKLGEEFDETTADGRKVKTTITWSDGVLTQRQKWDSKETTITRELKDGKLVVTCIMGDVKCVRTYERV